MKIRDILYCGAAFVALPMMAGSANAAVINLIDQGGVAGSQAEQGFKIAASYWGSILSNNVTINLGVGFSALDPGVIGQTGSNTVDYSVANWESRVNATKSGSTLDQNIVLPTLTSGAAAFITSASGAGGLGVNTASKVYDTNTSGANATNNNTLYLNSSVIKAIGGTATGVNANSLDGEVTFSSTFGFDFNPTDGVTANTFDFIGVAIHEIGHALGFVSGVDYYDYYGSPRGPGVADGNFNFNQTSLFSALDMFRYSTDPTNVAPGTQPVLDLAVGSNSYFSIDGGVTALFGNKFATGTYNGDGDQASHWKDATGANQCGPQLGIMDPTFCYGQMGEITSLDLAAFDAMGWNLSVDALANNGGYLRNTASIYNQFATAVPEPTTWAMMLVGFGLVGGAMRRRSTKIVFAA